MIKKNKFALCVPVAAANETALQVQLNSINRDEIDYIEWRRDYLPTAALEKEQIMAKLLRDFGIPVIYTNRMDPAKATEMDKSLWQKTMLYGAACDFVQYVDVDLQWAPLYHAHEMQNQDQRKSRCKSILSVHNYENCYDLKTMLEIAQEMKAYHAHVMKIAHTPRSFAETLDAIENVKKLGEKIDIPIIHVLMGDYGKCARIFPEHCGGCLTYAKGIVATAKGQLSVAEIKKWRKNKKMIDCLPELC